MTAEVRSVTSSSGGPSQLSAPRPRRAPKAIHWLGFVLVVKVALMAGAVLGSILSMITIGWGLPGAGFLGAAAVVSSAYRWAPARGRLVSTVALGVGAWAAWALLDPPSMAPERWAGEPYASSYLSITSTYAGGLLTWVLCLLCWRLPSASEPLSGSASNVATPARSQEEGAG
jgi:hypothetical protein